MKPFQGMILLTTIGMILLMTGMVLSSMHALFLLRKTNQELEEKHQLFDALERATAYFVKYASTDSLALCAQKTIKKEACRSIQDHQTFIFEVLDLGVFPCLIILENQLNYASHHWLVNVRSDKIFSNMIQIRMTTVAPLSQCDSMIKSSIPLGILSWQLNLKKPHHDDA